MKYIRGNYVSDVRTGSSPHFSGRNIRLVKKSHKSKSLSAAAAKQAADCPLTQPVINPTTAKLIEEYVGGLSPEVAECMLRALTRRLQPTAPASSETPKELSSNEPG